MQNVFLKPRLIDGKPAIVPDPVTRRPLGEAGEWKARDQYWQRRIDQGDVVDATAEQAAKQNAPAAAEKPPMLAQPASGKSKS